MKNYCDSLNRELSGMRSRILDIAKEVESFEGSEGDVLKSHIGHLHDLASTVDWKLDILLKACPYDWHRHDKEFESTTSVRATEDLTDADKRTAGGYIGG